VSGKFHARLSYYRERSPRYQLDRRLGGPQSRFGQHRENSWSYRVSNSGSRVVQLVASRHTDCVIPSLIRQRYVVSIFRNKICSAGKVVGCSEWNVYGEWNTAHPFQVLLFTVTVYLFCLTALNASTLSVDIILWKACTVPLSSWSSKVVVFNLVYMYTRGYAYINHNETQELLEPWTSSDLRSQ
jgi:hypothetical protein